jgi:hypothetical protein
MMLDLLKRPRGSSLKELMKMTDGQNRSVSGFISGQAEEDLGLKVRSVEREGKCIYSIKP